MTPNELAISLTRTFLENGNYELAGPSVGIHYHQAVQAANVQIVEEVYSESEGIAGLSVQSVGVTKGAEEEKVIIYVTRGSRKALKEVPREVEGALLEVKNIGNIQINPKPASSISGLSHFFERNGRIACGGSVAPSGANYAGTAGAFATDGNNTFAISNNHVFADCNHTTVGMPILAPAAGDAKPGRRAPTSLCNYQDMIELRSGNPQLVMPIKLDAAYGRVTNSDIISSWQGDEPDGYDTPVNVMAPFAGMRVKKFGRTTGLTLGTVEAQQTSWVLPYKSGKFTASVWFEDTWTILGDAGTPFALPGDSGSLVVTEDGQSAVGLIFAANRQGGYGIMCQIDEVLQRFGNWQLLTNHGI